MIICRTKEALRTEIKTKKAEGKSIGFVPTMGYLHEGHLHLVEQARAEHDVVVLSIFVNPLQFGPNEDLDRYPRDFERDERLAMEAGVDLVFYPTVEEMYPDEPSLAIHVKKGTDVLCGASRPGHFDGVATVVLKLFNLVQPDDAYFGMKDAQQVAVIMNMVRDLNLDVRIVPCETVRETDGLAKSSRNVNLTAEERTEAPLLYQTLQEAKEIILTGEREADMVRAYLLKQYEDRLSGNVDYVELLSYPDLEPIKTIKGTVIIAVAYRYSAVRLIDNIVFTLNEG
ncbi:pantoate--beta-alanine ligase [Halalkalibacterium ligniniphilum]|uniref:pantoate--beta-alanine ligase n=1 Tax=Halalkalibacterium ligniniphilum TaxID=1134413 RepID=UPI0003475A05|nr:pantoate--beta-alanine ligase [Halalkalibacterium ligniniphilum]